MWGDKPEGKAARIAGALFAAQCSMKQRGSPLALQAVLASKLQAGSTEQQSEALMHGILLCERFVANAQGTEAELEVLKQEVRKVLSGQVGCMSQHCAPWQALLVQEVLHRRLQGREPRRQHRILVSLAWWLLSSHSRYWREQPPLPSPA